MLQIFNDQVDSTCLHSMSIFMESQFPGKMKKTKNVKSHIHLLDCAIICFIITLEFHFHQLAKKNSPDQRTRNRLLSTQSTAKIGRKFPRRNLREHSVSLFQSHLPASLRTINARDHRPQVQYTRLIWQVTRQPARSSSPARASWDSKICCCRLILFCLRFEKMVTRTRSRRWSIIEPISVARPRRSMLILETAAFEVAMPMFSLSSQRQKVSNKAAPSCVLIFNNIIISC